MRQYYPRRREMGFETRLILHERDNLETRAQSENRPAEELWVEAVGEWPADLLGGHDPF
jgi:hypothetical protein